MDSMLLTQLEGSQKEVQSLKHQLMNFRATNVRATSAASKDHREQESQIETLEARVEELEEEKETLESEKEAKIKKLEQQNEKLSEENRRLLDTKSKLQARDTQRQSHLQTLTSELTQMHQMSSLVEHAELQAVWQQLGLAHHEMANVQELFQSIEAWFWKLRKNKDLAVHIENSSVTLSVLEDTMDAIRERLEEYDGVAEQTAMGEDKRDDLRVGISPEDSSNYLELTGLPSLTSNTSGQSSETRKFRGSTGLPSLTSKTRLGRKEEEKKSNESSPLSPTSPKRNLKFRPAGAADMFGRKGGNPISQRPMSFSQTKRLSLNSSWGSPPTSLKRSATWAGAAQPTSLNRASSWGSAAPRATGSLSRFNSLGESSIAPIQEDAYVEAFLKEAATQRASEMIQERRLSVDDEHSKSRWNSRDSIGSMFGEDTHSSTPRVSQSNFLNNTVCKKRSSVFHRMSSMLFSNEEEEKCMHDLNGLNRLDDKLTKLQGPMGDNRISVQDVQTAFLHMDLSQRLSDVSFSQQEDAYQRASYAYERAYVRNSQIEADILQKRLSLIDSSEDEEELTEASDDFVIPPPALHNYRNGLSQPTRKPLTTLSQ
jgi:hypothetical protein